MPRWPPLMDIGSCACALHCLTLQALQDCISGPSAEEWAFSLCAMHLDSWKHGLI